MCKVQGPLIPGPEPLPAHQYLAPSAGQTFDSWGCPGLGRGVPSLDSGCVAVGAGTGSQFLELGLV